MAGQDERRRSPLLERVPFTPDDADGVVDFCVAQGSPYDRAMVRRLLCTMTSAASGVLVWRSGAGLALVAVVVDRALNTTGAANLEILGVVKPLDGEALWERAVQPALSFARGGSRQALHVALYPWLVAVVEGERTLRAHGFVPAYTSLVMGRACDQGLPDELPLEAGWRWTTLDGARIEEAHAAILEAFADTPSFGLSPLPDFQVAVSASPDLWQVLLDGDRIAGLVRLVAPEREVGKINMVGRIPAYQGRGIGPRLVARALHALVERGATRVTLDVESANARAVRLYERFGFMVESRTPVLELSLGVG